jgi:hypothetical protein
MSLLTREAILTAADMPHQEVPVPEWGGQVRVKSLTAKEQNDFAQGFEYEKHGSRLRLKPGQNYGPRLVVLCAVDADGSALFGDGDVVTLAGKSGKAVARLVEAIQKLNGMSEEEQEEIEKNSGAAPSGVSS